MKMVDIPFQILVWRRLLFEVLVLYNNSIGLTH